MLALKWFSTYFIENLIFLILNSFKMKKFQKINFYLFLNIYFNLYKKTNISKTFSKYFLNNINEFNTFLFIYLTWTSSCLLNGKKNWFLLLLLLNSKNYKIKTNSTSNFSSNFIKNNPFKLNQHSCLFLLYNFAYVIAIGYDIIMKWCGKKAFVT